ncbi:MAG: hypothetical protein GVY32_11680 [Gammaproteobacteria bacterium]|jgi:hypothetical protein|nr:hypothetical protein [Gammaproteobacteria bacterium]
MKFFTDGRRALLSGIALAACMGFAFNAQAQTCTVQNWTGGQPGLSDSDAGLQTGDGQNRRYGGPCGLQVDVDGTARFVTDDSPQSEGTYIARFYAFLDNAGSGAVQVFGADDGTNDQIQVWYNDPNAGDLTLRVYDNGGTPSDVTFTGVGTGWHSMEFVWEADAAAQPVFSLDGTDMMAASMDTSGLSIVNAHLGNVNGANTGGTVDFDDFDSRRIDRPGRLLVADANDDTSINVFDAIAVIGEYQSGMMTAGQPDCDENGSINVFDAICVIGTYQN